MLQSQKAVPMLAAILPFCTNASHPYTMHLAQLALNKKKAKQQKQKEMIAVLICCCSLPVNQAFVSKQAMKMYA